MIGKLICAGLMLAAVSGEALAGRQSYCRDYARDVAHHRSGGADILAGTLGGAATGAVLGGIIDGGKGAGRGAIIGGVGGTLLGGAATGSAQRRAYERAYATCMNEYEPEPVYYDRPPQGSDEWYDYCASKYRSFNPDTGMYRTNSGRLKRCR